MRTEKTLGEPRPAAAAPYPPALTRAWYYLSRRQVFIVLIVFLVFFALLSLSTTTFLSPTNLAGLSRNFSWLAIVALGQSLVIVSGGIDLSVGATMALAALVAARCMHAGLPVPLAIAAGLLVGILVGWGNGSLVAHVRLPPFVVTLATMAIARGLAYGITLGWSVTNLPPGFVRLGQSELPLGIWSVPVPFLVALGVALLFEWLIKHTVLGSDIFALSSGEHALLVTGVDVVRLKTVVYTLCGLLAATGGIVFAARLGVAEPTAALGYELDVVAASVIGGTSIFGGVGNTLGVLLGAGVTVMLYNGLVLLGLPASWQTAAIGLMILLTVLLDYWRRRR